MAETEQAPQDQAGDSTEVQEAQLPEASDQPTGGASNQMDVLFGTELPVVARLGQTNILVRDLLQLAPGSVLKLDQRVGEPIELVLNGNIFATGQLVVVEDQLGIRIREICSPAPSKVSEAE